MPDGRWDPAAFVDACDAALNRPADAPEVRWLRELQRLETEVLLDAMERAGTIAPQLDGRLRALR